MRYAVAAALLALLVGSTTFAESQRGALIQLQIVRTNAEGGTIKGVYNGTSVEGTYSSAGAQGTWTLSASGVMVATGTYTCDATGCTFTSR